METSNPKATQRVGKALTALWLKGAHQTEIDTLLAKAKTVEALESEARWFPIYTVFPTFSSSKRINEASLLNAA